MCVPLSGSQAKGGLPAIARSIEPVSGKIGTHDPVFVTTKSWTMLERAWSLCARVTLPSTAGQMLTVVVKRPLAA